MFKKIARVILPAGAGGGIICWTMHLTNTNHPSLNSLETIDIEEKPEIPEEDLEPEEEKKEEEEQSENPPPPPPPAQSGGEQNQQQDGAPSNSGGGAGTPPPGSSSSSTTPIVGPWSIKDVINKGCDQITY